MKKSWPRGTQFPNFLSFQSVKTTLCHVHSFMFVLLWAVLQLRTWSAKFTTSAAFSMNSDWPWYHINDMAFHCQPWLTMIWPWWLTMVCSNVLTMVHSWPWSKNTWANVRVVDKSVLWSRGVDFQLKKSYNFQAWLSEFDNYSNKTGKQTIDGYKITAKQQQTNHYNFTFWRPITSWQNWPIQTKTRGINTIIWWRLFT